MTRAIVSSGGIIGLDLLYDEGLYLRIYKDLTGDRIFIARENADEVVEVALTQKGLQSMRYRCSLREAVSAARSRVGSLGLS